LTDELREELSGQVPLKVLTRNNFLPLETIFQCVDNIPEEQIYTNLIHQVNCSTGEKIVESEHLIPKKEYDFLEKLARRLGKNIDDYNIGISRSSSKDIGEEEFGIEIENEGISALQLYGHIIVNPSKKHMCGYSLKNLPEGIESLGKIKDLYISSFLEELPKETGKLTELENLFLTGNKLTTLPESIGNLKRLKTLCLHVNELSVLPDSIGDLENLEILYLGYNKLISLPDSIGGLTNLKELYVFKNPLASLPESIGNLGQLEVLSLNGGLTVLPKSISNLKNLERLYLGKKDQLFLFATEIEQMKMKGIKVYA